MFISSKGFNSAVSSACIAAHFDGYREGVNDGLKVSAAILSVSYCVIRVEGVNKVRTPISSDLEISEAIALCNESNNDYADLRTHFEIAVF